MIYSVNCYCNLKFYLELSSKKLFSLLTYDIYNNNLPEIIISDKNVPL